MSAPPIRTDRIRLVVFVKRRPDLTREEFLSYWREKHAPLFMSLAIAKSNILKYEQLHPNEAGIGSFAAMGLDVPEYDGVGVFEARSFADILAIYSDEDYLKRVQPDEEKFIDKTPGVSQVWPLTIVTAIDK
ncbi:EthD domain-containing protein [Schizophyllum amplum]|uniref:EthD domain-containing protein n=1 Tax=Schizophyllum amplum TaxID=97359 RepID=A0A550CUX7_9AGAR|nr:EthD domain-containing protein [Auriculariopsis ampla]